MSGYLSAESHFFPAVIFDKTINLFAELLFDIGVLSGYCYGIKHYVRDYTFLIFFFCRFQFFGEFYYIVSRKVQRAAVLFRLFYNFFRFCPIFLSAYDDVNKSKIRIFKDDLPDVADIERIGEINLKINDGAMRGDTFYKNKWYSMELINKIQEDKKDYNWRKYI